MAVFIKRYWFIALVLLGVLSLLYPRPNQGFLFRNIPELRGQTRGLIGSSTALFLDPSFYYRFEMSEAAFLQLVNQLGLEAVDTGRYKYYQDTVFALHRPYVWHNWWWKPNANSGHIFTAWRNGNILTFVFVPTQQQVFLYIQNT